MIFPPLPPRTRHRLGLALLIAGFASPLAPAPLYPAVTPLPPPRSAEPAAVIHVAQSQEAAQLALRIQQLEEQIRNLTGQVEGLQFQLTQMQTLIERMTEDNEFRFQQLEGGAGGKPEAATESGGVTPSAELPQTPVPSDPMIAPEDPNVQNPDVVIDPTAPVGESLDPLVGTDGTAAPTLGTLPESELGTAPLDLSLETAPPAANADAVAQYNAGYDAIVRGDFAFAEDQFRQFVSLYPTDPQAADATNWLGEALLQRGAYDEAADVLLTGFQAYPDSPRAPDLLLKLGVALAGAGERETACRTYLEVKKRYPQTTPAFQARLTEEEIRAECPPG